MLAKSVLRTDGVVYGAAFVEDSRAVEHVRVDEGDNLDQIMRSKYVQSTVSADIYEGVERDLRGGRKVLFSGTTCQVAAMRNYLSLKNAPTGNLLLLDVICHGVPSPKLWAEWVDYVSRSVGSKVDGANFRSKSTGWLTFSVTYYVATEKVRSTINARDWYMKAFLHNASLRQSCLDCPAKRCCGSDITLGDFWGIQTIHPEAIDDLGVSAVVCNTEKGAAALVDIGGSLDLGASSMDEVISSNSALVRSVVPYPRRAIFLEDLANGLSIDELMQKWKFNPSVTQRVRAKLSKIKHTLRGDR